jgi:hypothetical protein
MDCIRALIIIHRRRTGGIIQYGKIDIKNHNDNTVTLDQKGLRRVVKERLNRGHYTDNLWFRSY